ncbi:MAG: spore germination protein [Defluviitaleaceae bacterium]|nr:spore germination protein [Defluviitaleaceae bacterium]MCL2836172.1 spore germination protein [Defluviitaleaceae bacterium]
MFSSNEKISARQLQALTLLFLFGTSAIFLPNIAISNAGQNGWAGVLIAAIFAAAGVYLMASVGSLFRGKSFHEYSCLLLSRPLGKLLCLILAIRALAGTALELRIFGEIIKSVLLPLTPYWLIAAVILALGWLAVYHGYETRGRIAEILVFAVFVPLLILLVLSAFGADYSNLLPVLNNTPERLLKSGFESGYAFAGIELVLVAVSFTNAAGETTRKCVTGAVVFMGILLSAITALVIARLTPQGALAHDWPLLELLFTTEIPGSFMERQNAIVISFWILTVFARAGAGLFFGSLLLRDMAGKGKRRIYLTVLVPVVLLLSLIPDNASRAYEYSRIMYRYSAPALVLALPFVLLVIARLRRFDK